jgi:hypothetical protein
VPFEPHLIVFASVAAVEGFRGLRPRGLVLAGAVSLASAALLLPQVPRSLSAWPDYGIDWQHRPKGWRTLVRGSAVFNVRVRSGVLPLEVRARRGAADSPDSPDFEDTRVEVFLGGRSAGEEVLAPGEARKLEYPWPKRTIAYVELRAKSTER